jgi:hypothetical protein
MQQRRDPPSVPPAPTAWPSPGPRLIDVLDTSWRARVWRLLPQRRTIGLFFSLCTFAVVLLTFAGSLWLVASWFKTGNWAFWSLQ